jgi:hypothetical protein
MPTWVSIGFPVCVGLTVAGLIASWFIWRKSGSRRGARAVAWSLFPLAVYLVGAVHLVGQIGAAVVQFAGGFVFSTRHWAGAALLGVLVLVLLTTGGIPLLGRKNSKDKGALKSKGSTKDIKPSSGKTPVAAVPAKRAKAGKAPADDDDLGDVEEILRRHGIS